MAKQFAPVSCTYGAPMGRHASPHLETARRSIRLFRVKLDSGGYDDGGAYWGLRRAGESLYCAVDRSGDMQFTDATSRAHAAFLLDIPWSALTVPGDCEEWAQRAIEDTDDVQAWVRESHMVENEGTMNAIEKRYGTVLRCYDNGGKTADRYTIIPPRWASEYREFQAAQWSAIASNAEPFHPQGIGMTCTAIPGPHLGKRIRWNELPQDVQKFARQSFPEYAPRAA